MTGAQIIKVFFFNFTWGHIGRFFFLNFKIVKICFLYFTGNWIIKVVFTALVCLIMLSNLHYISTNELTCCKLLLLDTFGSLQNEQKASESNQIAMDLFLF